MQTIRIHIQDWNFGYKNISYLSEKKKEKRKNGRNRTNINIRTFGKKKTAETWEYSKQTPSSKLIKKGCTSKGQGNTSRLIVPKRSHQRKRHLGRLSCMTLWTILEMEVIKSDRWFKEQRK